MGMIRVEMRKADVVILILYVWMAFISKKCLFLSSAKLSSNKILEGM
jgi:hypothetical protein